METASFSSPLKEEELTWSCIPEECSLKKPVVQNCEKGSKIYCA